MNEIIAYFKYKDINYYIAKYNNKILFFKNNNQSINVNLSKIEQSIVMNVYKQIIATPMTSVFLKNIEVNENKYSLYIDRNNSTYYWLPLKGLYNKKDNIFLNFKYNHNTGILYNDLVDENKENSKFIKKFIKIGSTVSLVLVSAAISANLFIGQIIPNGEITLSQNSYSYSEKYSSPREYNYDYSEIELAIKNNPNLSEEEKAYINSLKFIFDENHQYMNLDLIRTRLSTLKIIYAPLEDNVNGRYNSFHNEITLDYNDFESSKKSVLIHELLHVFQRHGKHFILELTNEFFTREAVAYLYHNNLIDKEEFLSYETRKSISNGTYIKPTTEEEWLYLMNSDQGFGNGYNDFVGIHYVLAEILPEEVIREYQFNPSNIDLLAVSLASIEVGRDNVDNNDIEKAYQLLEAINSLRTYDPETDKYTYEKDPKDILEKLDYYYQKAKNISMYDDINLIAPLKDTIPSFSEDSNYIKVLNTKEFIEDELNTTQYCIFPKTTLSDSRASTLILYFDRTDGKLEEKIQEVNEDLSKRYEEFKPTGKDRVEFVTSTTNSRQK